MPIGNGGIIGPANVPTITTASGVWSLREQQQAQGRGAWPLALTPDPYFEYTTLLLPGNGTDGQNNNTFLDSGTANSGSGFTITRNGNTTQGTFSPFSQTGWGNYFNGTNALLSVANNAAFNFGTGDFTIEAWVFFSSAPLTDARVYSYQVASSTVIKFAIDSTRKLSVFLRGNGGTFATTYTSTNAISAGSWAHIALTRSGTTGRIFVNGNLEQTQAGQSQDLTASVPVYIGSYDGTSDYFNGYISNLRVVKGQALYTGAFTPATSALTVSTVGSTGAGVPTQTITGTVSLLSCQSNRFVDNGNGNSGSGFTITVTGSPSVVAFSPFNPTLPWIASINGGSGYFDGGGDALYTPNTGQFAPTGDFTIGFWAYPITLGVQVYLSNYTSNLSTDWSIETTASGTVDVYTNGSTRRIQASAGTLTVGAWFYIALVRSSNIITLYVNGVSKGTYTQSGTFGSATKSIYIGANTSLSAPSNSYISDVILIDGTPTTTVPTQPSTAVSGTRLLLNFTNAGIYDATSKNDLETLDNTVNGVRISTAQSKFGGSSIYFDGTGTDYLWIQADQPIQRFGTAPFTIELWIRLAATGSARGLVAKGTSTTGWLVSLNTSNQVVFTYGTSTITSTGTISAGAWTYIAVVREGTGANQTKIYISGVNDGTGTVSTDFTQTSSMYIGADRTGGSLFSGYMQDVRITNGYARTVTTIPTTAFPVV